MLFTQEEEAWGEPGLSKVTEASDKAAPCREAPEQEEAEMVQNTWRSAGHRTSSITLPVKTGHFL